MRTHRNRFDRKLGNQQIATMKTTLDLPDALVREIKLHALNEGTKLKDTMAALLRRGLQAGKAGAAKRRVKLPLIACKRRAELTPDQVAAALSQQEAEWHS
jgi:hypothetical protein